MPDDWTIAARGAVTAAELARELGGREPRSLVPWHRELAAAAAELARATPAPLRWGTDDPVEVLVRAVGRLACSHPHATSAAAGALVTALTGSADRPAP